MYILNDRPIVSYRGVGPGTTPTLKLQRHGGGTVGGPVRVYTSNPLSFYHQGNRVVAEETVHLAHARQGADLDVLMRSMYGDLRPVLGEHPGMGAPYLNRPGGIAWPDTSSGAGRYEQFPAGPPHNYEPRPGTEKASGTTRLTVGGEASHQALMARGEVVSLRPGLFQQGLAPQRPGPFGGMNAQVSINAPSRPVPARSGRQRIGGFFSRLWRA